MSTYKLKEVIPEFVKVLQSTMDIDKLVEEFLGQAYDAGWENGQSEGYDIGHSDGFEEGYKEAKSERD